MKRSRRRPSSASRSAPSGSSTRRKGAGRSTPPTWSEREKALRAGSTTAPPGSHGRSASSTQVWSTGSSSKGSRLWFLAEPDTPDYEAHGVWLGVAGVLAVAERHWPDPSRRVRLADLAHASLDSPALEVMFGHPGHMALAAQLHARTGEQRWAEIWSAGADRLLEEWRHDEALGAWLWTQRFGTRDASIVGAAHGLVGNVHVLLRGGLLLAAEQREDVEHRAVGTLTRLAVVEDGMANWPPVACGPLTANDRIRVQWCHGAAGILISLWDLAPDDEAWGELLLAAGRLVWQAGPIRDGPGLCHGTAGNAYALLALWRRTGDDQWLERARAFAQHAATAGRGAGRATGTRPSLPVHGRRGRGAVYLRVPHRR